MASKCLVGHRSRRTALRDALADEPTRTTGEYQASNRKVVDLLEVSPYTPRHPMEPRIQGNHVDFGIFRVSLGKAEDEVDW